MSTPGSQVITPSQNRLVTFSQLENDTEVRSMIDLADKYLDTIGYTDHSISHVSRVATWARMVLKELDRPDREAELAAIAGLLHDIGNAIHRIDHAQTSALMAWDLLRRRGMALDEIAQVCGAIANHDEGTGEPISNVSAAVIIADKSDVRRSRVRNPKMINFDIHDRVNYAVERTELMVDKDRHLITLKLTIDTQISQVMEYFEIFTSRMIMSRRAANFLNCDYSLIVNETQLA